MPLSHRPNPNQAQIDRLTGPARAYYDSFTRHKPRVDIVGNLAVFTWTFSQTPSLSPMQIHRAYSPHATRWALRQRRGEQDAAHDRAPAAETTGVNEEASAREAHKALDTPGENWGLTSEAK
jgi:hypothetical protein